MPRPLKYLAFCAAVYAAILCTVSIARADDGSGTPSGNSSGGGIDPYTVGLIVAGAIAGGGGYAYGKSRSVTIEPQPLKVEMAKTFATIEDLRELAERVGRMEETHREDTLRTHNRLDEILTSVNQIVGLLKGAGHNL